MCLWSKIRWENYLITCSESQKEEWLAYGTEEHKGEETERERGKGRRIGRGRAQREWQVNACGDIGRSAKVGVGIGGSRSPLRHLVLRKLRARVTPAAVMAKAAEAHNFCWQPLLFYCLFFFMFTSLSLFIIIIIILNPKCTLFWSTLDLFMFYAFMFADM